MIDAGGESIHLCLHQHKNIGWGNIRFCRQTHRHVDLGGSGEAGEALAILPISHITQSAPFMLTKKRPEMQTRE